MPDTFTHWPLELLRHEAEVSGDPLDLPSADPYSAGWAACMAWLARVPPEELTPEAREMWCAGFDDAMDAPIGSVP